MALARLAIATSTTVMIIMIANAPRLKVKLSIPWDVTCSIEMSVNVWTFICVDVEYVIIVKVVCVEVVRVAIRCAVTVSAERLVKTI